VSIYDEILASAGIPKFAPVKYRFETEYIGDIETAIHESLAKTGVMKRVKPGASIAIAVGSREIDRVAVMVKLIIDEVKKAGGAPFIVPSMGSHAGASAEGQTELLKNFGITEDTMGVPIKSSMETEHVGMTEDGLEVRIDRNASQADGIILITRVKPHTSFRGKVESGLMKMMAIGLGKQYGAALCHQLGFSCMGENVWNFGRVILEKKPVLFGLAVVENSIHKIIRVETVPSEEFEAREPELLVEAKSLIPRIPFKDIDMLVVDEMGKEYSGTGIDLNVVGRNSYLGPSDPNPARIAVFDLTDKSHGNASGLGTVDVITEKFEKKIDRVAGYVNGITVKECEGLKTPAVMENERQALKLCIYTLIPEKKPEELRAVWIHNTTDLSRMYVSEGLLKEVEAVEAMEIIGPPEELEFDGQGNIARRPGAGL